MTIVVAYPYDPNGTLKDCKITDECHVIATTDNTYRVIAPELAPFFRRGLVVTHAATSYKLVEGVDYYLGHRILSVKDIASSPLFATIVLINPNLFGEFSLTYQTVGSTFVGIRSEVMTYLANHLVDPVQTPFERIIDRPEYYVPYQHAMHYADFLNKEGVEDALIELREKIETAAERESVEAIGDIERRIDALHALLDRYRYDQHIVNKNNPHRTTSAQALALSNTATAADSLKLFNRGLMELADYINVRGIVQDDIDLYLRKKTSQTLGDRISLKDGVAVIRNVLGNVTLNLANGNYTVTAANMAELLADSASNKAGTLAKLASGKNELTVGSRGAGRSAADLKYNGSMIYTSDNIGPELADLGASASRLVTDNTEYVELSGAGWKEVPLKADLRLPVATLTRRGITSLSSSVVGTRKNVAATSKAINTLRLKIGNYVPNSTTINGYPLTKDITITKTDLNIDRMDNTSDRSKPISSTQQQILDTIADGNHRHSLDEIKNTEATDTRRGIMVKYDNVDGIPDMEGGVTPRAGKLIADTIKLAQSDMTDRLHSSVINLKYWNIEEPITVSGFVISIPTYASVYINQVDFDIDSNREVKGAELDLAALYPTNYKGRTFYVYIKMVSGDIEYYVSDVIKDNPLNTELRVFSISTNDSGIIESGRYDTLKMSGMEGIAQPVVSVGMFTELLEHMEESNPHSSSDVLNPAQLGLGLVNNAPVLNGISAFSHENLPVWDRITTIPDLAITKSVIDVGGFINAGVDVKGRAKGSTYLVGNEVMWGDSIALREVAYVVIPDKPLSSIGVVVDRGDLKYDGRDTLLVMSFSTNTKVTLEYVDVETKAATIIKQLDSVISGVGSSESGTRYHIAVQFGNSESPITVTVTALVANEVLTRRLSINRTSDQYELTYDVGLVRANSSVGKPTLTAAISSDVARGAGRVFGLAYSTGAVGESVLNINCVQDSGVASGGEYITAEAALNTIQAGSNILVLSGRTSGRLPVPPPCSRYMVLHGLGKIGVASTAATQAISGVDIKLNRAPATATGVTDIDSLMVSGVDTIVPHDLTVKYKTVADGAIENPTRSDGLLNYMIVAFRDI